ncbi:hypothetical protein KBZ94_08520 [Streptomyces sp. RM72]|uniref:hypothetical protein n=1 Tax=Streptomyces sp. RM72 TaxID=1115510 RepID=UPI001B362ED5|nr:hypothetical protein [Streptomyces sp. RM72]MBQ0884983.1 hypothetical protein [Streptomyces sp. RM72]
MQDIHSAVGTPLEFIQGSLDHLGSRLDITEEAGAKTHTVVIVRGLDASSVAVAFGRYLVGVLAGAVGHDARISADLLAQGADAQAELKKKVISLVGLTNNFTSDKEILFRDTKRNAWIAEGVAHGILVLRANFPSECVTGAVQAVAGIHAIPTEQGLDSVALYLEGEQLVVAIGESKASAEHGTSELTKAAQQFADVDQDEYGVQLRSELMTFRAVISTDLKAQVSDALWRNNRCYLPFITHEVEFDLHAKRLVLERLSPPVHRKRLIALRIERFHGFFDTVADTMRSAVSQVVI